MHPLLLPRLPLATEVREAGAFLERHAALVAVVFVAGRAHVRLSLLPPHHVRRQTLPAPHTTAVVELALAHDAVPIPAVQADVQPQVLVHEALRIQTALALSIQKVIMKVKLTHKVYPVFRVNYPSKQHFWCA